MFLPLLLLIFIYINFLTSLIAIQQVFPSRLGAPTNNVILALKSINLKANNSNDFNKFKLYSK